MGLELILTGLSAVVGAVGTVMQANAASKAAAAQREARAIEGAQQEVSNLQSRRQRIREERIRRQRIIAASANQGTTGSSGELGSVGSLSSNLASLVSSSLGETKAIRGINSNNQRAADFLSSANTIGAWTNTLQQGIGGFQSIFDQED